jgi:hypothetical protein
MNIFLSSLWLNVLKRYMDLFPDGKINVLASFATLNHDVATFCRRYRPRIGGLILDSGVWTKNNASSGTERITVEAYIAYLRVAAKYYDFFFNFDENFNADGFDQNYTNQLQIETSGFCPVPVVHDIEGDEITVYIDRGYSRVALGSRQIKSREVLKKVMGRFEGTGIKIHLFGNTKFDLLANAPLHSCDTAMWARTGGWGTVLYWNPHKEGENKTDRIYLEEYIGGYDEGEHINFSTYADRREFEEFLWSTFGLRYEDLIGPGAAVNKMLVNAYFFVQLEKIITDIHTKKGFNTDD